VTVPRPLVTVIMAAAIILGVIAGWRLFLVFSGG
jgi:hypothetical protein